MVRGARTGSSGTMRCPHYYQFPINQYQARPGRGKAEPGRAEARPRRGQASAPPRPDSTPSRHDPTTSRLDSTRLVSTRLVSTRLVSTRLFTSYLEPKDCETGSGGRRPRTEDGSPRSEVGRPVPRSVDRGTGVRCTLPGYTSRTPCRTPAATHLTETMAGSMVTPPWAG